MDRRAAAALRIQCAARRRLAVHRASNALKLVVRVRWGPLEGGACEAVLDTTRPAFPVVLLSADHASIGKGHVIMPLAALVQAAERLSVTPHAPSSSSPASSPTPLERVQSNSALRRLGPNNTALVEALRLPGGHFRSPDTHWKILWKLCSIETCLPITSAVQTPRRVSIRVAPAGARAGRPTEMRLCAL